MDEFKNSVKTAILVLCVLIIGLQCIVPLGGPEPEIPFKFSLVDTTNHYSSPFGSLKICFSRQLKDPDSVNFIFSPPFLGFYTTMNTTKDTAILSFAIPLTGNNRYIVTLSGKVESIDGSVLVPGKDSVVVTTYPVEHEPNNDRSLADSLSNRCFGSISTAHDTDWYLLSKTTISRIYLVSTGSTSMVSVYDASGFVITPKAYNDSNSVVIPSSFVPPLYLSVYSYGRSTGGYYELGCVSR